MMKSILGLLLLICIVLPAHAQESLTVVTTATTKLDGMVDRYLTRSAEEHWRRRERELQQVRSPEQVRQRQEMIRAKVLRALGGFTARTPLHARIHRHI